MLTLDKFEEASEKGPISLKESSECILKYITLLVSLSN